jgi:hypothetical protein
MQRPILSDQQKQILKHLLHTEEPQTLHDIHLVIYPHIPYSEREYSYRNLRYSTKSLIKKGLLVVKKSNSHPYHKLYTLNLKAFLLYAFPLLQEHIYKNTKGIIKNV